MKLKKLLALASVALTAGLLLPDSADAGGGWGPAYKPDLRVHSIQTSLVSPTHVRLIVTNQGQWSSPACYTKVTVYGPTKTSGYVWVPAMNPGEYWGVDGWVGQHINGNPGQMTVAWIDCFQQIAESNEGNNVSYYYAPPW